MRPKSVKAALLLFLSALWAGLLQVGALGQPSASPYESGADGSIRSQAAIPSQSLGSQHSREVVVTPYTGSPAGTIIVGPGYGPGSGGVILEGGRSFTHRFGLPSDYNANRYYHAYPQAVYSAPQVVEKQTTVEQPRTEYDTYGIGNTIKVERLYSTTKRQTVIPPATVYEARPDGRFDRGRHVILHPHVYYRTYQTPGAVVEETDKSVTVLSAERAGPPGSDYARMVGPNGQVYVVPMETIWAQAQGSPSAGGSSNAVAAPGFAWTPRPLSED